MDKAGIIFFHHNFFLFSLVNTEQLSSGIKHLMYLTSSAYAEMCFFSLYL